MNELLSSTSLIAAVIYLYVGFYTYRLNRQSKVCKIFLLLNISMAIWSFAYSFAYTSVTSLEFSFWNKLSAFGWCSFSALTLYLVLLITENKLLKYWYIKLLVILPAPVFLYMALFLFGPNIKTNQIIETIFYTGNFLYNFSFLLISIFLLLVWGRKSKHLNQKKQAKVIVIASASSFLLNLILQNILPIFGIFDFPLMGQIHSLIMLLGVYYAIVHLQFMIIPTSLVNRELFNEISGLTFLVDLKGIILKSNKQVYNLLNYTDKELVGTSITSILDSKELLYYIENCESMKETKRFEEIDILSKLGAIIPFSISLTPLSDSKTQTFLGLLIVGRDSRATRNLQNEVLSHKITYKKLQKSEELFRNMVEIIPFSIILTSRADNKIIYINSKAEELFRISKQKMIGCDASSLYNNLQDRLNIIEDINNNIRVKEREITFKRTDDSTLLGLITIVPTIYLEEEVVLACISDITKQKKLQHDVVKSEKLLKELMNSIQDMITVVDLDGNITFANNSARNVFDIETGNDFSSENILSVLAERDLSRLKSENIPILSQHPSPTEYKSVQRDGITTDIEVIGTVLCDENNKANGIIYVSRDVTERKQAEETLKQNSKDIEKMNNALIEVNRVLKNRSIRDSLTNLYNHQYINEILEQELLKANITNQHLCVMMLDIDFFKHVNDTYGHQVGDDVLVGTSNIMLHNVRITDFVGRYGGEEFLVILPDIHLEDARQLAERLRLSIQEYDFGVKDLKITISIGLTQLDSEDGTSIVNRVDTLLYQAKRKGRNRIEITIAD